MSATRPAQPAVVAAARALAGRRDVDAGELLVQVPRCARGLDLGGRRAAALREAAELVGVYLSVLAPPQPWEPLAGEQAAVDALAEAHVVWGGPDGQVLADVLDCGGAGKQLWTARTRGLPRRVAAAGADAFGEAFSAARLVALSAPARSLAVVAGDATPRPLPSTPWWFAAPPVDGDAAGEAAA